jgi:acetyl-CoA carboxylase carboxyltransferase component
MEDTTGFLPGKEQESRGIVQAGRAMLDAIIDLRTPRFLVLVRNAIGGAYASYNNYPTGADLVIALPTTRVAVMGSPGVEFVYKDELRGLRGSVNGKVKELSQQLVSEGAEETAALEQAKKEVTQWLTGEEAVLVKRYEKELMNPKEALSLGSISQITMPSDLRQVLSEHMKFHLENYTPEPFNGVQREFH